MALGSELIGGEGLEAWSAWAREHYGQYNLQGNHLERFSASIRTKNIYGLAALDIGHNLQRVDRTHQDARRDGMDQYKLIFQTAGRSILNQNNQVAKLVAGDIALVDMSRPVAYLFENGPNRRIALNLPRRSMVTHLALEPQGGASWCGETSAAARALFRLILDALNEEDTSLISAEPYMQLAVYDLFGALFVASGFPQASSHADKVFARASRVIKAAFCDPNVGPNEVATEVGISLRYLQKLFSVRGLTCTNVIRSHRLERAAHLLQRRAVMKTQQPLSEIAYASGFRDYNAFYRMFRHRFGISPGAIGGTHSGRPE
jgi:AraC family transcriptional regulator, positive regulator of tynA and feaB